ncbi:MAG: DUF1801 domain-containing protein [Candidatus Eisenbacteria bacterium]
MAAKSGRTVDVDAYMHALKHARKEDVEALRAIIRGADGKLVERIKWNAPSYGYDDDRVTFRLQPKDIVQLIFHRGAKKRTDAFEFEDETGLLEWLAEDRAVVTFESGADIRSKKAKLKKLVVRWMKATG